MTQAHKIPIRIRGRGTVIGFCKRAPLGTGLTLALIPKLAPCDDDGDQLTLNSAVRTRLAFDFTEGCYWADDYTCLANSAVEPY